MNGSPMYTQDIVGNAEVLSAFPRTRMGTNGLVIHRPSTGAGLDAVKEWLDKESLGHGIKNKYLVAGLAACGLAYYGHKKRWF